MTLINQIPFGENIKQTIASHWWMPLVRGNLLVLFGVIMFVRPGSTLLSLIWLLGIYWIVDGIFSIIFLQDDQGEDIARRVNEFIEVTSQD